MSTASADHGDHAAHGHDHAHGHDPHLAHHFDTPAQQFSTGKLGMWTFLATEILMFGGLFCAYAVYRSNHPDVYLWAHRALDAKWGMINTIVLLASSFTMAWGVRAAQLNQKGLLQIMLALTFMGGVGFMCIKAVEYQSKWKHFLFPGTYNAFNVNFAPKDIDAATAKLETISYVETHGKVHSPAPGQTGESPTPQMATQPSTQSVGHNPPAPSHLVAAGNAEPSVAGVTPSAITTRDGNVGTPDAATILPPAFTPAGTNLTVDDKHGVRHYKSYDELNPTDRQTLNAFFSIYFMMTGLHGIHVVVGMGIIAWLFVKASAGVFSEKYFAPVDLGGLYWHLVDLIWIFLFPLLYLIH